MNADWKLEDLRIASPCTADWTKMTGDDRVRFCGSCEKYVYDVSGMSREEAHELVRSQGEVCVRLSRRADGTVITNDCPVGVGDAARRRRAFAVAAGGLLAASALLLRNRVFGAEAPPPRAQTHLDELETSAPARDTSGTIWEALAKLAKTTPDPEPRVMMGDVSMPEPAKTSTPPPGAKMGRIIGPRQPIPEKPIR